ncbi:hypothetical protein [Comamonas sp. JUb58]|uniref:hypothetical protein n=1 Tax=Comamonas sp. JUb58 TaxID=2485114 RepID=UPI00105CCE97|nr:hypothetical protein [Comamonas sp. JUb58]TDS73146.1 hypothetical protein EDF71_1227 [Comamonas sp. JUb58]
MINSYSFRIRIIQSPSDYISADESEILLVNEPNTPLISLKIPSRNQSLNQKQYISLTGKGYLSQVDAENAGKAYETILMIAFASVRIGADFGDRAARGIFTNEGIKYLEQSHGQRVLNDTHGLMVFLTEPKPLFALTEMSMQRGVNKEKFRQSFEAAKKAIPTLTERDRLAFGLFNASLFQTTAEGRFLLLVMALEAMIEPTTRSPECQAHVDWLMAATKKAEISKEERESMLGAIRSLKKESINQAGRRLAEDRLNNRRYDDLSAPDFFTYVYRLRSNLVHGNIPYPTVQAVGNAAAPLEVFVSELLTIPFIGIVNETSFNKTPPPHPQIE